MTVLDTPRHAGTTPDALARAAGRLLGTACDVDGVLGRRAVTADDGTPATVLVVALRTAGGGEVVAKKGPTHLVVPGARAQERAGRLCRNRARVLRAPHLLALDEEAGLAVSSRATGVPLSAAIRLGDAAAVAAAGRALADLARLPGEGPPLALADHLRDLLPARPEALGASGLPPALLDALDATARAVAGAGAALAPQDRLVHRDVHPRQLVVRGGTVTLLDWDLAATGDPALDLANLVQHSRTRLAPPVADRVVATLLDGCSPGPALAERLGVHEAFAAVRLACKAARLHGASAEAAVRALLARARRLLGGGHG